jgi:hypothetical protein
MEGIDIAILIGTVAVEHDDVVVGAGRACGAAAPSYTTSTANPASRRPSPIRLANAS